MNNQMKVGFFGVKSWEKKYIEKEIIKLPTFGVGIFKEEVERLVDKASIYNVISVSGQTVLNAKLLDSLPAVKMMVVRTTGSEKIDKEECQRRGVVVKMLPDYGARAVAEYAMGLLLTVTKKIVVAKESVEEGDMMLASMTGMELYGKTIGVIGVGKIGINVVRIAKGFGMHVIGVERNIDGVAAKKYGFKPMNLESCLKVADLVTIHVPSNESTYHLMNKKTVGMMKKGSVLINTSRGPVVDTEAVVWGLNKGILSGAGLDAVEETEGREQVGVWPEVNSFRKLVDRDDVVFTPHNGFNVEEVWAKNIKFVVEEIEKYLGA